MVVSLKIMNTRVFTWLFVPCAFCFAIATSSVSTTHSVRSAPPAVKSLNVSQYVGRWYQVYGSASVQWTMEVGGHCVTADYGVSASRDDVVTVQNAVDILGTPVKVNGYGIVNPKHAGELDVFLGPPGHGPKPSSAGSFKRTNYLVFGLGPVITGKYDYALVSDPTGITLYVLARNVSRFHKIYESRVLDSLKKLNYTSFINRPRKTDQTGCKYVPP
jgi:lipocalin